MQNRHVHFDTVLTTPPADRRRVHFLLAVSGVSFDTNARMTQNGTPYPSVAQRRSKADRVSSEDLFWGSRPLSAASSTSDLQDEDIILPATVIVSLNNVLCCLLYQPPDTV